MNATYFVAEDASGYLCVWCEDEGREHRPLLVVARCDLDNYLWQKLTEGMERR